MSSSIQISIEITDEEEQKQQNISQSFHPNRYTAIASQLDHNFDKVISLQSKLKTQNLLLDYEEKRKNEKIKEIQYTFVNAYNNFLWSRRNGEEKQNVIILNEKDLIAIDDALAEELNWFRKIVFSTSNLTKIIKNDLKPPQSFLIDFMNYFPHWQYYVSLLTNLEVQIADKIENSFESQYTFASKMLANLRFNDKIQRFCSEIFKEPLKELGNIEEELIVDFVVLYEKWYQILEKNKGTLTLFLQGKMSVEQAWKNKSMRIQIERIYGKLRNDEQVRVLLQEMNHFARKQESIAFLLAEVGSEELSVDTLNLFLSWLVWKKIVSNRKKLQSASVGFVNTIIDNYKKIPNEIKYVVKSFHINATKKWGEIKFEDFKSFFNKVIFSQLFFSQFMWLHEQLYGKQDENRNFNLTMIALASQKIMFGQQFYEKYKYGFFNPTINHFAPEIRRFILQFGEERLIQPKEQPNVSSALLSFDSIKFLYENSRQLLELDYQAIQNVICKKSFHNIASAKYHPKNIYVVFIDKPSINYHHILKPHNKIKRTLIDFLLLADKIAQKSGIRSLLQQYRCAQQDCQQLKPSVQLYANYLWLMLDKIDLDHLIKLVGQIESQIERGQRDIQIMKISLQKEHNFALNLQKMYMKLLSMKKKDRSRAKLEIQINNLMSTNLGFDYQVIDGKICELQNKSNKTMKKCLYDIADFFMKRVEGTDALYHWFLEKVVQQLEKGVLSQNMISDAKSILGERLYRILNLQTYMGPKDLRLYDQMRKHEFVTFAMLDLKQYEAEQELIIKLSVKILEELSKPCCPDRLLAIFHEVSQVFTNVMGTICKAAQITADVQIPMMMIAVLRSQKQNLPTLLQFIKYFCTDEINSSALGQTFTLVQGAVQLIEELNYNRLNLSEEQYSNYISESYMIIE